MTNVTRLLRRASQLHPRVFWSCCMDVFGHEIGPGIERCRNMNDRACRVAHHRTARAKSCEPARYVHALGATTLVRNAVKLSASFFRHYHRHQVPTSLPFKSFHARHQQRPWGTAEPETLRFSSKLLIHAKKGISLIQRPPLSCVRMSIPEAVLEQARMYLPLHASME